MRAVILIFIFGALLAAAAQAAETSYLTNPVVNSQLVKLQSDLAATPDFSARLAALHDFKYRQLVDSDLKQGLVTKDSPGFYELMTFMGKVWEINIPTRANCPGQKAYFKNNYEGDPTSETPQASTNDKGAAAADLVVTWLCQ